MRGAVIGFGNIALGHLAGYEGIPDVTIAAVVDPVPARLSLARQMLPGVKTYYTPDELFEQENLDFLDICSPPTTHRDYIRAALDHGCHVLCEKPFLVSPQEYKGLLSNAGGRIVYPSHNYKFSPVIRQMLDCIHSHTLGDPIRGHFRIMRIGHARGVAEWQPDWRRDSRFAGGGILYDHGPHSIYLACRMSQRQPVAVSCLMGTFNRSGGAANEDTVLLTIDFGTVTWTIDLSWASASRSTYYSVIGHRGAVMLENDRLVITNHLGEATDTEVNSGFNDSLHREWFYDMIKDFLDTIAHPERQHSLMLEAITTNLVIEAAYISTESDGAWVEVSAPPVQELYERPAVGAHASGAKGR